MWYNQTHEFIWECYEKDFINKILLLIDLSLWKLKRTGHVPGHVPAGRKNEALFLPKIWKYMLPMPPAAAFLVKGIFV